MGFGTYDESEQEQPGDKQEDDGESVTKKGESHGGTDKVADESVDDMLEHL